jgi:2-dehydro-3-deoxyphosphogluconate aldolase/(4S)-4-hydroxy-2-oxoglutarate aldolase
MTTAFPEALLVRLRKSGVVAGFSVESAAQAVPLCRALLAGGIDTIELTLRSAAGMDGVKAIAAELPEIVLGVGTILTPEQAREVKAAGATFGVAPGMNPRVVRAAAEAVGGINYLRSMSAPYKHLGIQYFPLGGLNDTNMLEYLNEPNVPTIGGSWIVKPELVAKADWAGITARASSVVQLLKQRKAHE